MLAVDGRRELGGDEPRQRNGTGLIRLRGAQDDVATNIREGTPNIHPAAPEVDVADTQGRRLTPAPGVGK